MRAGEKLTAEKAEEIRALLRSGETGRSIAARFGVTPALVSMIRLGLIWRGGPDSVVGVSARSIGFWGRVRKTEACWLYEGKLNRDGHGQFARGGKTQLAHRWAWSELRGAIPHGAVLMHACDVPACVNPDHLQIGTHSENQRDKTAKGRQAKGSAMGNAILTEEAVRQIRARYIPQPRPWAPGGNAKQLAAEYGVTTDSIYKVVNRQQWRHA